MKPVKSNLIRTLLLTLACFATALGQGQTTGVENPAHQELRKLRDDLLAAMNKGELDALLPFLHTNCIITWHNAEVSRGHEGVRTYFNRVMKGPSKIVESFHCDVTVDELTILYGDNIGVCYGSSDEQFKLAGGKNLNFKGRWSATLARENGRWLVANLHASTNLFDNLMLDLAKQGAIIAGVACLAGGLVAGWFWGRRRKPAA
jgi:ketosteroid isomerase-like protein